MTSPAEHLTPDDSSRKPGMDPVLFIVDDRPGADGELYLLDTTAGADYSSESEPAEPTESSDSDLA
ncbi:hypothetical protein [Flindersiella endophytica]